MAGWIKISKDINKHWIWSDPVKLQWWLDILLTVNFEDKKFPIGYKVFECKRGESLMSLLQWAKRWNVSKSAVNNFFTMLENDNMIKTVNETVTTRLIVCNYDTYQQTENANKTKTKRKQNGTETQQDTTKEYIKNEEEIKEEEEEIKQTILTFDEFWDLYDKKVGKTTSKALFDKTTEAERKLIKEYIPKYKKNKPDVKYRKDPERFLKYKVWEDEIISDEIEDNKDKFFANGQWHKKTPMQKYQ